MTSPPEMTLVDSHAHLDRFGDPDCPDDPERAEVLARAHAAGVSTILAIGIGDGPATMHRARDIAREAQAAANPAHPRALATAGIYPGDAELADQAAYTTLAGLLADPLVVACGEIGLDYYHVESPPVAVQKACFVTQMQLAATQNRPIILHCRTRELATPDAKARFAGADAWDDLLALLTEHWRPTGLPGIMHCFSGTPAQARRSLDLSFYLSFAGNLTYPAAAVIREAAALAPADRILVETDSPFLAPVPFRGQRNEPALVRQTADALAHLRGITSQQLTQLTTQNFETLFPNPPERALEQQADAVSAQGSVNYGNR